MPATAPRPRRDSPTGSERAVREPGFGGLERLEHRNERLGVTLRFTYAFHAREVRFERDAGDGFRRVFPETFSFHADRHDLTELYLQLEDVRTNPRLIAENANARDAERVITRLCAALPGYLEGLLDRLERGKRLDGAARLRVHEDVSFLTLLAGRFMADKGLDQRGELRPASLHLRKLAFRALLELLRHGVSPEYVERYTAGEVDPFSPSEEVSDAHFFYALARGGPGEADRWITGMAERAFYRWLEEVCLDEPGHAFDREDSPFERREAEVLRAATRGGEGAVRARDLAPFLRRPRNRDCLRVLGKLGTWFLRQYDVHHAAVVIRHADRLGRGRADADRRLSRHSAGYYLLAIAALAAPFLGAAVAYDRAPRLFDALCSAEVLAVDAAALWFLAYRFCWRRDLTVFHASVPRIGAGIIVGYLPVFLIDEVWDLARGSSYTLGAAIVMLGFATLLYLYVEIQRRLGDRDEAFARARTIFLLGVLQALALGIITTGLFGRFMVSRNWTEAAGVESFAALEGALEPFVGELPRIVGFEPFVAFPSALLLMTFLSFFIGTFLQLMWEDLPITEPL